MADVNLLVIILAQLLVLVLIAASVLLWWVIRLRRQTRRLMNLCQRLRAGRSTEPETPDSEREPTQEAAPDWAALAAQSLERYRHLTGKALGDYAPQDPFSARIASVRYQYLQAEQEANEATGEQAAWLVLERRVARLITLLLNNAKPVVEPENDRERLLRQRLKALRQVETDNKKLHSENATLARRIDKLNSYRRKYQALIAHLQRQTQTDDGRVSLSSVLASQDKHRDLVAKVHHQVHKADPDLYRDKRPVLAQVAALQDGAGAASRWLEQVQQAPNDDQQRAFVEKLRLTNQAQRKTIVELQGELRCLRRALRDAEEHSASDEVARLEQLVRETESCIQTLESEVDDLYAKLEVSVAPDSGGNDAVFLQLQVFAREVVSASSVEEVASLLARVFTALDWPLAFAVTHAGAQRFYNFSEYPDAGIKQTLATLEAEAEPVENERGLLLAVGALRALFPVQMQVSLRAAQLVEWSHFLGTLAELQLEHANDLYELQNHQLRIAELVTGVKESVANIEIQYAYGTEQAQVLVDNLIVEMRQLVAMAELEHGLSEVFEAAISEAADRFAILRQTGGVVDSEIAKLAQTLDQLD
ncbi:hypothetical protein [Gilvimarinus xylanilyticus]|uniref:Uncharacterized protein n=1 Tax=Gilvimarinus xylanilyticus TaxID=2944139 RepID=A0A9X2I5K3_9GAMM|nr:hypothetical protein [Gilvimarinus xylanilyticus]MCP8899857.1 hypothetical protein [Gilvimarinus xylanilyticus]